MENIVSEDKRFVLGVDLGGTKILASVVTPDGTVIGRAKKKTRAEKPTEEILERLAACCADAVETSGVSWDQVVAIGIGSPGPLDPERGIIIDTPNINLTGAPLTGFLEERFGKSGFLDNDVNVGTYGEFRYGAARGFKDVIGIFMGTGVGGGLIIDGKLHRGASFNAGEIGHIKVSQDGRLCGCGQAGCLEAYASKTAIVKRMKRKIDKGKKTKVLSIIDNDWSKLSSSAMKRAVEEGDSLMIESLKRAAKYTGIGIGSLLNVLSPQIVVLGGGMIEAMEDFLLPVVKKHAHNNSFAIIHEKTTIVPAALGDDAGILGAAALAWDGVGLTEVEEPIVLRSVEL